MERALRPYRVIYLSLLFRLIFVALSYVCVALGSILFYSIDISGIIRVARAVSYVYGVVMLLSGLIIFFALTELRSASPWLTRAGTWFVLDAAVNMLADLISAAVYVLESRLTEGGAVPFRLMTVYYAVLAAALLVPLFTNLFMYGNLLRGYRDVRITFGRDGESCLRAGRLLRIACFLLLAAFSALLPLIVRIQLLQAETSLVSLDILTAASLAAVAAGGILRLIAQLRILCETKAMAALVKEISI